MPESLAWYNHIELAGLFFVIVYIAGTIVRVLIERWLGNKGDCKECSEIKRKQAVLRESTLPELWGNIDTIRVQVAQANTKLDLIMRGLKLVSGDDK